VAAEKVLEFEKSTKTSSQMTYDIVLFTGFREQPVKTFGAHKCAHELRLAGFQTLVVNHLHDLDLNELKKILDLFE
jgi:hypothetical protein